MAIVYEIKARPNEKKERDRKIRAILQSPDADFVDMALRLVNLEDNERAVLDLCLRRGLTHEKAAEELDVSVDALQKWHRSAKDKIWTAWSGRWWIRKLMEIE
jgi:DNA-directed RNA polymerase specialized sigma24 family protein